MKIVIDENVKLVGEGKQEANVDNDGEIKTKNKCCTWRTIIIVIALLHIFLLVFFFAILPAIKPQIVKKKAIDVLENEGDGISDETKQILKQLNSFVVAMVAGVSKSIQEASAITDEDLRSSEFDLGWIRTANTTSTPYGWKPVEIFFEESDSRDPTSSVLLHRREVTESFHYDIIPEDDIFGVSTFSETFEIFFDDELFPLRDNFHFITDEDTLTTFLEDLKLLPLGHENGYLLPIPAHNWDEMVSDEAISRIFWYGFGSVLIMGPTFTELYSEAPDVVTPSNAETTSGTTTETVNTSSTSIIKESDRGYSTSFLHRAKSVEQSQLKGSDAQSSSFYRPDSIHPTQQSEGTNRDLSAGFHRPSSMSQPQAEQVLDTPSATSTTEITEDTTGRTVIGYQIDLDLSSLAVRKGYRPYGFRIIFDTDQKLVSIYDSYRKKMIHPTDGVEWERAKYLVKQTTITVITAQNHAQWSHIIASNTLSRANTIHLPPSHPLRRLLNVFTYGTNIINQNAEVLLLTELGIFHRQTSFEFPSLLQMFDAGVSQCNIFQPFQDIDISDKPGLQSLIEEGKFPYYTDGLAFYKIVGHLVTSWFDFAGEEAMTDEYVKAFYQDLVASSKGQAYEVPSEFSLDNLIDVVTQLIWVVTAYHEIVGTTVEYITHPSFMGARAVANNIGDGNMIITDTEAFTLGTLLAAFSGRRMPSLVGSFSNYFARDGAPEWEIVAWGYFQEDILEQGELVKAADVERIENGQPEYKILDPTRFECAVSL